MSVSVRVCERVREVCAHTYKLSLQEARAAKEVSGGGGGGGGGGDGGDALFLSHTHIHTNCLSRGQGR